MVPCHAAAARHSGGCSISRSPIFLGTIDGTIFSLLPPPPAHQPPPHAARPSGSDRTLLILCAASGSSLRRAAFSYLPPQFPRRRFCVAANVKFRTSEGPDVPFLLPLQFVVGSRKAKVDFYMSGMSNIAGRADRAVETPQGTATLPDHLLVLVHGILASPSDWKYVQGELRNKLGSNYFVHASNVNLYLQTLSGINLAGRRLADEVRDLVKKTPTFTKVSFVAHSLGGLFSRYAIAILYEPPTHSCGHGAATLDSPQSPHLGTIAGLQPIIFVTLATPHLGVRGKKQLPFLLGVPVLEKIAAPLAPFVSGRTGRQLFLTDGKASDPPLLLRMASDCEEGKFISALRAFKLRILYANVSYDHMVGWRTSSIRRETELVKPPKHSLKGYKHVVSVTDCPAAEASDRSPSFQVETVKAKEAAQNNPTSKDTAPYHDMLEEEMIKGLQRVSWRKVDVSFHSALWPFLAHNHIHVKQEWLYYEGAGVVAHLADTIKEKDFSAQPSSKL